MQINLSWRMRLMNLPWIGLNLFMGGLAWAGPHSPFEGAHADPQSLNDQSVGAVNLSASAPLARKVKDSFVINPRFDQSASAIVLANDLAYDLARYFDVHGEVPATNDPIYRAFPSSDWTAFPFLGKTGETQADLPGVVLYESGLNLMIIAFHGSRNAADWRTNYDSQGAGESQHDLPIAGLVHRGFARKVAALRVPMLEKVRWILDGLDSGQLKNIAVFMTGHSQGAALASLASVVLIEDFRRYFGASFDNARLNTIQLYRLSSPRVAADERSANALNALVGIDNDVRQNVEYDPVPSLHAGPQGRKILAALELIDSPAAQILTAETTYRGSGRLALQSAWKTVQKSLLGNINPNPSNWLGALKNLALNGFGALHLGSVRKDEMHLNGYFDYQLVDTDLSDNLKRGDRHEQKNDAGAGDGLSWLQQLLNS